MLRDWLTYESLELEFQLEAIGRRRGQVKGLQFTTGVNEAWTIID